MSIRKIEIIFETEFTSTFKFCYDYVLKGWFIKRNGKNLQNSVENIKDFNESLNEYLLLCDLMIIGCDENIEGPLTIFYCDIAVSEFCDLFDIKIQIDKMINSEFMKKDEPTHPKEFAKINYQFNEFNIEK